METYGDIINRMIEIVKSSQAKRLEFSGDEHLNDYFAKINHYYIYKDFQAEYKELLDMERTFFLLESKSLEDNIKYNEDLINLCTQRLMESGENQSEYLTISKILRSAMGKKASELIEYGGYFVPRNDLLEFIQECKKANVGPFATIKELGVKDFKARVNGLLNENKEQYKRISYYLNEIPEIKEEKEEPFDFLNMDHKDIIYLGLSNKLTLDMLKELQKVFSEEEYNKLLETLLIWQIFTKEEIESLLTEKDPKIKEVNDIDELIQFFSTKENVSIDGLKLLIPAVGRANFEYMIDSLCRCGAIPIDDYLKYINEKYNLGEIKPKR